MRTGDIWENSNTYNVDLFDTVSHFRVTAGILNGEWKEVKNQHPLNYQMILRVLNIWHILKITPWSMNR